MYILIHLKELIVAEHLYDVSVLDDRKKYGWINKTWPLLDFEQLSALYINLIS